MAESYRLCPICETHNHPNAAVCLTCGASISHITPQFKQQTTQKPPDNYDFRYGETDLLERELSTKAQTYLILGATLGIVILLLFIGSQLLGIGQGDSETNDNNINAVTPSLRPTLPLMTVTIGAPTTTATMTPLPTDTPTETPTPAPCIQVIVQGDSLIGAITRCGYTTLDIMPTVMALNNITDTSSIRSGQEVIIPWPSATIDPNSIPTETPTNENTGNDTGNSGDDSEFALIDFDPFAPTATATLPAGVMWHTVEQNENIITIAVQYNANAKVLSELNPEVDFARCEFGERFGGPECLVQLFEGQVLRVPAPSPTPTLSPTPDPNATATPTATATYNEPNAQSPSNAEFFGQNDLVTLRWVPTATLNFAEQYKVTVTDLTSNTTYTAVTRDISFILPIEWQGRIATRHTYEWKVGIISAGNPDDVRFETAPLTFVWQGLVENN